MPSNIYLISSTFLVFSSFLSLHPKSFFHLSHSGPHPFLMVARVFGPLSRFPASHSNVFCDYNSLLSQLISNNWKLIVLDCRRTIFLNQWFKNQCLISLCSYTYAFFLGITQLLKHTSTWRKVTATRCYPGPHKLRIWRALNISKGG